MLTSDQRKLLAEFYAKLAVAWLGAGVIAPLVAKGIIEVTTPEFLMSAGWGVSLITLGMRLVGGEKG
jgi:hypothetical protein